MSKNTPLIGLGVIGKPHGLSGEVNYFPYNKKSSLPIKDMNVWLGKDLNPSIAESVESVHFGGNSVILKLHGILSREQAEEIQSLVLFISRSQMPDAGEKENYLTDLINCKVLDEKKSQIGVVEDVLSLPANDVLVVNQKDKEYLIPLIEDVVKLIDIQNGEITIEIIPGLLD